MASADTLSGTEWYYSPELIEQWFVYDNANPNFNYT